MVAWIMRSVYQIQFTTYLLTFTQKIELDLFMDWYNHLPTALEVAEKILTKYHPVTPTIYHGDLWPAHVNFKTSRPIGMIDFENLGWSTPVADIAQIALHFADWSKCIEIVEHYNQQFQISAEDRALLPAAALLDLISEGYWSLQMLCSKNCHSIQRQVLMNNLQALLPSLRLLLRDEATY